MAKVKKTLRRGKELCKPKPRDSNQTYYRQALWKKRQPKLLIVLSTQLVAKICCMVQTSQPLFRNHSDYLDENPELQKVYQSAED